MTSKATEKRTQGERRDKACMEDLDEQIRSMEAELTDGWSLPPTV